MDSLYGLGPASKVVLWQWLVRLNFRSVILNVSFHFVLFLFFVLVSLLCFVSFAFVDELCYFVIISVHCNCSWKGHFKLCEIVWLSQLRVNYFKECGYRIACGSSYLKPYSTATSNVTVFPPDNSRLDRKVKSKPNPKCTAKPNTNANPNPWT